MVSKVEYIALVVVGIVLLVSVVQAVQLSGLNSKISTQNTVLAAAAGGQSLAGNSAPVSSPAPQPASSAPTMVGGC